jgi:HPt (histidine-containing phosphotransfer) domain-containing protein
MIMPIEKISSAALPAGAPDVFSAAVDMTVLRSYEEIQIAGEPDLIVELIDLYLEDAPRRMAVMRKSLADSNWTLLKREAHSLRGSSGNVGALAMARICQEIEGAESAGMFRGIEALLSRLEQELERVLYIFRAERRKRLQ